MFVIPPLIKDKRFAEGLLKNKDAILCYKIISIINTTAATIYCIYSLLLTIYQQWFVLLDWNAKRRDVSVLLLFLLE